MGTARMHLSIQALNRRREDLMELNPLPILSQGRTLKIWGRPSFLSNLPSNPRLSQWSQQFSTATQSTSKRWTSCWRRSRTRMAFRHSNRINTRWFNSKISSLQISRVTRHLSSCQRIKHNKPSQFYLTIRWRSNILPTLRWCQTDHCQETV